MLTSKQRELQSLEHFGEADSLHQILKRLTDTYLMCQECFQSKNLPKSLSADDFEPHTLQHLLCAKQATSEEMVADEMMDSDSEQQQANFTTEDQAKLIQLVAEQEGAIDWNKIAAGLQNRFKPNRCLFEFLQMPISSQLLIELET